MEKLQSRKHLRTASYILWALFFMSCSDGENGEQGQQGPQGEQGTTGEQGELGRIAYFYSDWLPVEIEEPISSLTTIVPFDAEAVTSEIMDSAIILGYARLITGEVVRLPYSVSGFGQEYSLNIIPGFIRLVVLREGGSALDTSLVSEMRYIIIPGTIEETGLTEKELMELDYDQAKDFFDISQ